MERKGSKRSSLQEKSPVKRHKKNQRDGGDERTNDGQSSSEVKGNHQLKKTIEDKIQDILETEKDIVEAKAQVLAYQNKCLRYTASIGASAIFDDLIKVKDIDVNTTNKENQTPLIVASQAGHVEIIKKLLANKHVSLGAVDIHGYTALLHSAANDFTEVLKQLLAKSTKELNHKNLVQCSALVLASNRGHPDIVKELLTHEKIQVNSEDESGDSALIHAAEEGHPKVVEMLLAHPDIKVNLKNGNGDVSLMCASNRGHEDIVEKLLKVEGISVNVKNNDGYTALMCAADKGNNRVMDLLLAHRDIDVNIVDENQDSALNWAVDKEHKEIVRKIFGHGRVEKNKRNMKAVKAHLQQGKTTPKEAMFESTLIIAIEDGEYEIVKWLLEHSDVNINRRERDTTPLIAAVKGESRKVFQLILSQSGIDVNATDFNKYTPLAWAAAWADKKDTIFLTALAEHPDIQLNKQDDEGYTALGRAAELGRWEAVVYLTYLKGIDVNLCGSDDMTPLLCAAGSGHRGVVNSILNCKGVNVNCSSALTGYSPLIWASDRGHAEVVEELLKHKETRVNQPDKNGYSALIWAADLNQPEIIEILLQRKDIKVNATDVDGHTALIWAADKGNIEVANQLLAHKDINPNLQDHDGLSALICAATMGQDKMVKRLLECDMVDVNLQESEEKYTALIAAVNNNSVKNVEALMQHSKLNMNLRDKHGVTAYQMAKTRGYTGILKMFAKQGLILQHPKIETPVRRNSKSADKAGKKGKGKT